MTMGPVTSFNKVMLTSMLMFKLSNVNELHEFIRHLTIFGFFSFYGYRKVPKATTPRKQRTFGSHLVSESQGQRSPENNDPSKVETSKLISLFAKDNGSDMIHILNKLRADVCKYRPEMGKINFSKNPKKIMQTALGILVMKI